MEAKGSAGTTTRRLHILSECPLTHITSLSHEAIQLYMWSVQFNGALPEAGGLHDQPAMAMEALSIIRSEMAKVEAWEMHEARKKSEQEAKAQQAKREQGSRTTRPGVTHRR